MRPQSVGKAVAFLILGGVTGLTLDLSVAVATFGFCCTSWTWGPFVTLLALATAVGLLSARPAPAMRGFGIVAGLLLATDIVNFDVIGLVGGIVAASSLGDPEARAYFEGKWTPPHPATLEAGTPGIVLRSDFLPLGFLLYATLVQVKIDGGPTLRLPWGRAALPLAPGPHRIRCSVGYLWDIHVVEREVEVPPEGSVELHYHAPGWLVMLPGNLRVAPPGRHQGATNTRIV